ncbi:MAG: hypothetical protein ACJAWW_002205 [Sulfurimonas sp.]|jgi:hypothetical protein
MKKFKYLTNIIPHIDDTFSAFYNTMLKDTRLSVFFETDEQIKHFTSSLELRTSALRENYIKLGEYHYDIRIPYVDFIKGSEILEEHFFTSHPNKIVFHRAY